MAVTVKIETRCSADGCRNAHVQAYPYTVGQKMPYPVIPEGWAAFGDLHYCPDHEVRVLVQVDGVPHEVGR